MGAAPRLHHPERGEQVTTFCRDVTKHHQVVGQRRQPALANVTEVERGRFDGEDAGDVEGLEAGHEPVEGLPELLSGHALARDVGRAVQKHPSRFAAADLVSENAQQLGGPGVLMREVDQLDDAFFNPLPKRKLERIRGR